MKAEQEKKDLAQATALMIETRQFAGQYTVVNEDVLRYSIPGKLVLTLDAQESSFRVTSSLISEVQKYLPTFPERTEFVPLTSTDFLIHGNCFHMSWTICEGDTVRFSKDEKGLISFRWGALIFQRAGPTGSSLRRSDSQDWAGANVRVDGEEPKEAEAELSPSVGLERGLG